MGASDNKKACEVASTARGDKPAVETAPAVMPIIVTNAGTTLAGRRVSVANVASMLPAVVCCAFIHIYNTHGRAEIDTQIHSKTCI